MQMSKENQTSETLLKNESAEEKPAPKDNRVLAILCMNVFAFATSMVSIIFKYINVTMGVELIELVLWRNTVNCIFIQAILIPKKKNPFTDTNG